MAGSLVAAELHERRALLDWGVDSRLAGEVVKCPLFTLRMSYSGKAVHRVCVAQAQQSFMDPPGATLPTGSARTTA